MLQRIVQLIERVFAALSRNVWLPALLARLSMAAEFISSGSGKLGNLPKLTAYFIQLGIPAPAVTAAATATTELVGGILLLLGLGTRFAAAALSVVMVMAIFTAKIKEVHTLGDFFYLSEPSYLVIFVWLVFEGGGKISLDHLIARRLARGPTRRVRSFSLPVNRGPTITRPT
jgi:putative oxidoreductase